MATIRDAIAKLADRLPLTEKEAEETMREIMAGEVATVNRRI